MDELQKLISDNSVSILSFLFGGGSFYGYWIERKKRKLDEKILGADALKSMQDGYDKFTQHAMQQYEELRVDLLEVKKKLNNVTLQLTEEQGKYILLKSAYDKLKISYDMLKRNFDNYKKENNS